MFTETIPLSQIKARRFVNKKELIEKIIFQVQVLIFFALKSIYIFFSLSDPFFFKFRSCSLVLHWCMASAERGVGLGVTA